MRRFTAEEAVAAVELEQFVADYFHELDIHRAQHVVDYWFEDGVFTAGSVINVKGAANIRQFYADRDARVLKEEKDGVRTSRHTFTNLRISFLGKDQASLDMIVTNYSAGGRPPIVGGSTAPSIVSEAHLEVRRAPGGEWRLTEFHGTSVFVGGDPFQNKTLTGEPAKA